MKKNVFVFCILVHCGIFLQSAHGESAEPERPPQLTLGEAVSAKIEELHEKSDALISAILAKIELMIANAKSSKKTGSCFLRIKCSQAEFDKLVGDNITVLSVADFNQKTARRDSLMTPSWWVPTAEMSTNFMMSKNFQQIVDRGHAFALYDKDRGTALFYFDWNKVAE